MQLDQVYAYVPFVALALGGVLILWGQRDRLRAYVVRLWPTETDVEVVPIEDDDKGLDAQEAYACFRYLLDEVNGCPKATEALERIVLPALVSGTDSPHYQVTWEVKP